MSNSYRNRDFEYHPSVTDMRGPKPPDWFVSNGCTCSPDSLFGVDISLACHYHDWHYRHRWPGGNNEKARYIADRYFLFNLKECGLPAPIAFFYYGRVRLWGHTLYKYDEGQEPERGWRFWWNLFSKRFLRW